MEETLNRFWELADMVEQSSDGLSGNWARHRNRRYKEKKEEVADQRLTLNGIRGPYLPTSYIEFYDAMSVPMAIALSGLLLLGQPVMVKPSEAEKNLVQSTTAMAGVSGGLIGPYSGGTRRLYVFEAFGQVELVQLPVDETGRCKGYGFVQFACLEDARNALSLNQQLEIACQLIKVSALTDQAGMQDVGANSGDFDNDEGGGLKLDRSGSGSSVAGSAGTPVVNSTGLTLPTVPILGAAPAVSPITPLDPALAGLGGSGLQVPIATLPTVDTIGAPSECLLLKDMFDPNDEVPQAYEAKFPDSR
ncbi:rna-binding protein 39 [Quercus suber]|uniref:Rna-binding protein 39 n=1 Tax=Quercus suber TaxID=58331 RepID=A0AAW0K7S5_QUESU